MEARALEWIRSQNGVVVRPPFTENGVPYVEVRCQHCHEWKVRLTNLVHRRSWCAECYGNKPLTIEAMREIAESRGGQCLSDEYHGLTQKLRWQCSFGHEWEATPNNVKNHGSWCPHCKVNVGEELVRAALEEAFPGYEFNRTRSEPWMQGLELDGYNKDAGLAFEYQGRQHFERVEHFQREEGAFEAQLERDELTQMRCDDAEVVLMVVPFTVGFANIRAWVRRWLEDLVFEGIVPATGTDAEFYDRVRAQGPDTARQYNRVLAVIHQKGGECISTQYLGYQVPMRIRCRSGHEFEATPEAICQPSWRGPRFCPVCGGTQKQTDDTLREKVEACGFAFLGVESKKYADGKTRRMMTVQCPNEHEYEVLWDNFKPTNGVPKKGCSRCHHSKVGASKRQDITPWCEERGIHIVESTYANRTTRYKWQCDVGHEFENSLQAINGQMYTCPECHLEEFATEHDLRLITEWSPDTDPRKKLTWRCTRCGGEITAALSKLHAIKNPCETCAQQRQQQE